MRLLIVGDLHLRLKTPQGRRDDFAQTQFSKLEQILQIAEGYGVGAILQTGDFFDSPNPANYLMSRTISQLRATRIREAIPKFSILGQHDMYLGSTDHNRTALYVLACARGVTLLDEQKRYLDDDVAVYGASFGSPIPSIIRRRGDATFNVLVAHMSIGFPLFEGHVIEEPDGLLERLTGFDLILVGDYHYRFASHDRETDRYIINAGAVVRLSRSKADRAHQPSVTLFDTEEREMEVIPLDYEPAEDIFDMVNLSQQDEQKEVLQKFVASLKGAKVGVSFEHNLQKAFKANKTPTAIKALVGDAMEEVGIGSERSKGR